MTVDDRPAEEIEDNRLRVPDHEYYSDDVKLPGYGNPPQRCRKLRPVGFCVENGHPHLGRSSCETWRCPDHWRDRLEESIKTLVAHLAAYRHAQTGGGKRLVHGMFSPDPTGHWTTERLFDRRRDAYEVAEEVGGRGGAVITHPYRSSELGDRVFQSMVETGEWEKERGKWSLFRQEADDWDEMRKLIEPSPHYHMLLAVEDFDPDGVPDDWVGWNLGQLPRFHYRDVESYRPMVKLAYYLLTHAGRVTGRNVRTYFGEVHSFTPSEELTAAAWERIQINAGLAVDTKPGESILAAEETTVEGRECPRDGCESELVPIDRLYEYLSDDDWFWSLDTEERRQLQGVEVWLEFPDRPPPSGRSEPEEVLAWLRDLGQTHHLGGGQSSLSHSISDA